MESSVNDLTDHLPSPRKPALTLGLPAAVGNIVTVSDGSLEATS